jgi:ankyrin repeat protein
MFSSQFGHTNVVQELLNKNANVNLQNKNGKTAYDLVKTDEIKNLLKNEESHTLIIRQGNEVIYQITTITIKM